jgi:hypothetical protein
MSAPLPGLYADCLWKTSLLPATITNTSGTYDKAIPGGASSVNGIPYTFANPVNEQNMVDNINIAISGYAYGGQTSGYDCKTAVRPCRYVIMTPYGVPTTNPRADQLIINADGSTTFLQTDWRVPPDYLPQF